MVVLYIVLFLHQTTTMTSCTGMLKGCISYYSYIKPQLVNDSVMEVVVVYRTIPTSNHNEEKEEKEEEKVVYRTIPTSNHNIPILLMSSLTLYIVLFLHQTTTFLISIQKSARCISYYSYIKPQRGIAINLDTIGCISYYSYIKPQLSASSISC